MHPDFIGVFLSPSTSTTELHEVIYRIYGADLLDSKVIEQVSRDLLIVAQTADWSLRSQAICRLTTLGLLSSKYRSVAVESALGEILLGIFSDEEIRRIRASVAQRGEAFAANAFMLKLVFALVPFQSQTSREVLRVLLDRAKGTTAEPEILGVMEVADSSILS